MPIPSDHPTMHLHICNKKSTHDLALLNTENSLLILSLQYVAVWYTATTNLRNVKMLSEIPLVKDFVLTSHTYLWRYVYCT